MIDRWKVLITTLECMWRGVLWERAVVAAPQTGWMWRGRLRTAVVEGVGSALRLLSPVAGRAPQSPRRGRQGPCLRRVGQRTVSYSRGIWHVFAQYRVCSRGFFASSATWLLVLSLGTRATSTLAARTPQAGHGMADGFHASSPWMYQRLTALLWHCARVVLRPQMCPGAS